MPFVQAALSFQPQPVVYPVGYARNTGLVRYGDSDWPFQQFQSIENIVDFLVFYQPVGMDARPGGIEFLTGKRIVGGHRVAEFGPESIRRCR